MIYYLILLVGGLSTAWGTGSSTAQHESLSSALQNTFPNRVVQRGYNKGSWLPPVPLKKGEPQGQGNPIDTNTTVQKGKLRSHMVNIGRLIPWLRQFRDSLDENIYLDDICRWGGLTNLAIKNNGNSDFLVDDKKVLEEKAKLPLVKAEIRAYVDQLIEDMKNQDPDVVPDGGYIFVIDETLSLKLTPNGGRGHVSYKGKNWVDLISLAFKSLLGYQGLSFANHGTLVQKGKVLVAGEIEIKGGKIILATNQSGHFYPKAWNLYYGIDAFKKRYPDVFASDFKVVFAQRDRQNKWSAMSWDEFVTQKPWLSEVEAESQKVLDFLKGSKDNKTWLWEMEKSLTPEKIYEIKEEARIRVETLNPDIPLSDPRYQNEFTKQEGNIIKELLLPSPGREKYAQRYAKRLEGKSPAEGMDELRRIVNEKLQRLNTKFPPKGFRKSNKKADTQALSRTVQQAMEAHPNFKGFQKLQEEWNKFKNPGLAPNEWGWGIRSKVRCMLYGGYGIGQSVDLDPTGSLRQAMESIAREFFRSIKGLESTPEMENEWHHTPEERERMEKAQKDPRNQGHFERLRQIKQEVDLEK